MSAAIGLLIASANLAACDLERFGEAATRTCSRANPECIQSYVPNEVSDIVKGLAFEWIDRSINDGQASWVAIDVARMRLIEVRRFAGQHLRNAPFLEQAQSLEYTRTVKNDRVHWVEHIRIYPMDLPQSTELGCTALSLWSDKRLPFRLVTDMSSAVYLLLPERAQTDWAPGTFSGSATGLEKAIKLHISNNSSRAEK